MSDKAKQLKIRRGQIKAELTRFERFLSKFDSSTSNLSQLEARYGSIQGVLSEFKIVQDEYELELLATDSMNEQLESEVRDEFETKYFTAVAQAKDHLKNIFIVTDASSLNNNSNAHFSTSLNSASNPNSSAKLPPLKIPEFAGSYSEWQQFNDTFKALIHNNNNLQDIERFYYLQGSLKGEAARVIASLPITDANYSKAYKLLQDRYENKKALVNSHVKDIFDLAPIPKESHVNLRTFLDAFLQSSRCLESLGEPIDQWDTLLIYLLISKLDFSTRKEWENFSQSFEKPTINDFTKFLSQRCQILELLYSKPVVNRQARNSNTFYSNDGDNRKSNQTVISCPFCKEAHYIYSCSRFKDLPVNDRLSTVKRLKLCINCLRKGHGVVQCRSQNCRFCQKKHNSLLHLNQYSNVNQTPNPVTSHDQDLTTHGNDNALTCNSSLESSVNNVTLNHYVHKSSESYVLLSTALVYVKAPDGESIVCRALLDSGSQSNFITKSLIDKLKLTTKHIHLPICGINQVKTSISEQSTILISSLHNNFQARMNCLVIDKITDFLPQETFDITKLNLPSLPLADPDFNVASNVDLLLGCSIFFDLLNTQQIKLGSNLPVLQHTQLGWIISGNIPKSQLRKPKPSKCYFSIDESVTISEQVERFWNVEEVSGSKVTNLSIEEEQCERHFAQNLTRNSQGRFVVKLPLKANYTSLGESESKALNVLYSVERRLSKNLNIKQQYHDFMSEYQNLNHMAEIPRQLTENNPICYLPHHAVLKPDSLTTKVRVVFNASSKTSSNLSLNDVLMDGPVLQDDLFSILIRFRKHQVVLIGDLTKMYRQILIHPDDVNLQRIVWRSNPDQDVKHYYLKTLTYGTRPASFIATRCLKQISIDNKDMFPQECEIISNDMYMDDLLTGCSNSQDLIKIRENLTNLLSQYGFELRKFQSNDPDTLPIMNNFDNSQYLITDNHSTKTLGVAWIPSLDSFQYSSHEFPVEIKTVTKRNILSCIAKLFDPLGILGPLLTHAKILMQSLWQLHIGWDDAVPPDIFNKWLNLENQFSQSHTIHIPRHVLISNPVNVQLHAFSDASEKAYGCAIYVRSVDSQGRVNCTLLCAKSRVAPLKTISLPRLELCGALLMSRLLAKCVKVLRLAIDQIYLWTDSTIVLCWIAGEPRTWKTFVANRVSEIQQLTKTQDWNYIPSSLNPADTISRGANLIDLINSDLWFHGPKFLSDNSDYWPMDSHISHYASSFEEAPEYKLQNVSLLCNNERHQFNLFDLYSDFNRLVRVTAYCLRFIYNLKRPLVDRKLGFLDEQEINNSVNVLARLVQSFSFATEVYDLKQSKQVSVKSCLKSLSPILDSDGLIRIGGRLQNSNLDYNQKHQIILPTKHKFTRLLILHEHQRCLHGGITTTLAHVRQKFWPLCSKAAVKSCIRNCIDCVKANPSTLSNKMGPLPSFRVNPSPPFSNSGVDFAGPFDLKDGKIRNRQIIKAYVCIFVCCATKAVHLELVTDLSSEGFLSVLKRFASRRGLCSNLYSDNGTNFVGASNKIQRLQNLIEVDSCQNYLSNFSIKWHFIPARSPHFGGLWEAAVKSSKHHLRRVLNKTPITYEEFYTILTQVEAVLNSRPITPLSSSPDDLEALTPAHFLIGRPLTAVPQADLTIAKVNFVKRYQHMQQIFQHFWSRWIQEYLHTLHQRSKWQFEKDLNLHVGSLVLLKEDNIPPLCWPLGRITEVHPGRDNVVRVVSVKTKHGVVKRSITKLSLLPIANCD